MKIIFMGTPDFAVPTFQQLVNSRHDVITVVTQPDRPKGRGKTITPPPIKTEALKFNIPVFQPEKVREEGFQQDLKNLHADIIVVVAFGQIIPKSILNLPPFGCINLHASLLPKYRGAAPIERAILAGETRTGNTTMLMDEGLDSGGILMQEEMVVPHTINASHVYDKLSKSGAALMLETLEELETKSLCARPQNKEEVTHAPRLKKEDGLIRWDKKNSEIVNLVRGLALWPVAYTYNRGARLKIRKAEIPDTDLAGDRPGEIVKIDSRGIFVSTGEGLVLLKEVQMEGKKNVDAYRFVQGQRLKIGEQFNDGVQQAK